MGLLDYFAPKLDSFDYPRPTTEGVADYHLISPCEFYRLFFVECRRSSSLYTAMYTTGVWPQCKQYKDLWNYCRQWDDTADQSALEKVLKYERELRDRRSSIECANDVWKRRDRSIDNASSTFAAPLASNIERKLPILNADDRRNSEGFSAEHLPLEVRPSKCTIM